MASQHCKLDIPAAGWLNRRWHAVFKVPRDGLHPPRPRPTAGIAGRARTRPQKLPPCGAASGSGASRLCTADRMQGSAWIVACGRNNRSSWRSERARCVVDRCLNSSFALPRTRCRREGSTARAADRADPRGDWVKSRTRKQLAGSPTAPRADRRQHERAQLEHREETCSR